MSRSCSTPPSNWRSSATSLGPATSQLERGPESASRSTSPMPRCVIAPGRYPPSSRSGRPTPPITTVEQTVAMVRACERAGVSLVGVTMYEWLVAGVANGACTPRGLAVRALQALSKRDIAQWRGEVVSALRELGGLGIRQRWRHRLHRIHQRRGHGHRGCCGQRILRARTLPALAQFPPGPGVAPAPRCRPPFHHRHCHRSRRWLGRFRTSR